MGKTYRVFLGISLGFLMSTGCVKKRPTVEAQRAELNKLVPSSQVATWQDTITTADEKPDFSEVSRADILEISPELKEINIQGIVKFETNSPFLAGETSNIHLIGRQNTKYPVKYQLTPKYLVIYKVVPGNDLSHLEKPYAIQDGATFLVPLGSYSVDYYQVGKIKNEENRDTNVKDKFRVDADDFKTAAYFKIDWSSFKVFNRAMKQDVLPADYFTTGEWYFAKSLVATKPGDESGIGYFEGGRSTAFEEANRIKFSKTPNFLRGVNAAIADQKKRFKKDKTDAEIADDVLSIPVQWENYEVKTDGKYPAMTEDVITAQEIDKLKYGRFVFNGTNLLEGMTFAEYIGSRVIRGKLLKDLHIDQDSFSFRILNMASGEETRYAFRRVKPSNYEPRIYRKKDEDTMGAFYTDVPYVTTSKDDRKGDIEKNRLINRFNPKNKVIKFRFSKDTPKLEDSQNDPASLKIDYRQVGRNCVKYWNRAFELAQTGIKVELDESRDSVVGDINNNLINIIDTLNESGLAGIGPSMADPETGEIIAGAANIYISAYRSSLTDRLRNFIRLRSGLVRDFAFPKAIQDARPLMEYFGKEVAHYCPGVIKFAEDLHGAVQTTSTAENEVIDRCLEKMLPRVLTEVTCHEMGHVFNLRHNFQCSADAANSYTPETLKKVFPKDQFPEVYSQLYPKEEFYPQSSCVMDYMPYERPMLMLPGLYDIAEIAYSYSGKVVKAGTREGSKTGFGELVSFDTNKSLKEQAVFAQAQKYAYCPDEYAGTMKTPPTNPFCMRHDFGNTPTDLMDYHFDSYREEVVFNFRKWDRAFAVPHEGRNDFHIELMASIYKLWRVHLHDYVGSDLAYLFNYQDQDSWNKLQSDLVSDPKFAHKEYLGISDRYVKYMSAISEIPDLYCVAIRKDANPVGIDVNTDVKLIRFTELQKEMAGVSTNVEGCTDPNVNEYLASKDGGKWNVAGDIGYPISDIQYSSDVKDANQGVDIVGIGLARVSALNLLGGPQGDNLVWDLKVRGHTPWALDEPNIYDMTFDRVTKRLFEGADLALPVSEFLRSKKYVVSDPNHIRPFKKFYGNETDAYASILFNLRNFREAEKDKVPDYVRTATKRPFIAYDSKDLRKRQAGEVWMYDKVNALYYFASPSNKVAYRAFNTLLELDQASRFEIGGIDPSSQDALWQMADLVKSLPVSLEFSMPKLNLAVFEELARDIEYMKADGFTDPTLKVFFESPLMVRIQQFGQYLMALESTATLTGQDMVPIKTGAGPNDVEQITPEDARNLLSDLNRKINRFVNFMETKGHLRLEDLTQLSIMKDWVESRNNEKLTKFWETEMVKTMKARADYMNSDPLEHNANKDVIIKNITQSLEWVHRDRN